MDVTNSPAMKETTGTRLISWHDNYFISTLVVTNLNKRRYGNNFIGTTNSPLPSPTLSHNSLYAILTYLLFKIIKYYQQISRTMNGQANQQKSFETS